MAGYLAGVVWAARRNNFIVPPRVLSLYRALLTLETLCAELGLRNALRDVGGDFFKELRREDFLAELCDQDQLRRIMSGALNLSRDGPGQLAQLLTDAAEGNFHLKVEVSDTSRMIGLANRRARLWAAALLAVSVSILLTIPGLPVLFGIPVMWPLGIVLAGLYLTCAWLWRRL